MAQGFPRRLQVLLSWSCEQLANLFWLADGHSEVAAFFGKDPREYSINTKEFVSDGNGKIKGINTIRVAWEKDALGNWRMAEVPGSEEFFPADLCVSLPLSFRNQQLTTSSAQRSPRSGIPRSRGSGDQGPRRRPGRSLERQDASGQVHDQRRWHLRRR